jgi:DNA processing protein
MNVDARVEAWVSLQLLSPLAPRRIVALLKAFGGPAEILAGSRANLGKVVPAETAAVIERGPDPKLRDQTLQWLASETNFLLALDDADYPQALLTIADPPAVLYYIGDRALLNRQAIAIVGSRNATPQGLDNAESFAAALSAAGMTILSGLALGIDAAAHRGGLAASGSSVAVVGTGLDRVYPAKNRALARALADRGGLLSEFALGTPPLPGNFPRRNRLISGLALGVLVVEATLASGSLITARFAAEQGRDVFAIPGSIHSPFSKGSHRLIKDGAKLVETAADVLDELGVGTGASAAPIQPRADPPVGNATKVLAALGHDCAAVDILSERTGLAVESVAVALVQLEISGDVSALPGGLFQRIG